MEEVERSASRKLLEFSDELYEAFLLILESEQGDCKDLSLLLRTVGRENTAKILEVFEGKELSIPSEASKESRLKFINGYLRYSCNGESWDSVVAYLYGPKASIRDRRSLRDGIREVKKRCDRYAIDIKEVLSKQQSESSMREEGDK
jgi:hypothetical protein